MSDRGLLTAFGLSILFHLAVLGWGLLPLAWLNRPLSRAAIRVVYEPASARQEERQLQAQLTKARRAAIAGPSPAAARSRPHIHVASRPLLIEAKTLAEIMPQRSSVFDLTNLVDASRGDPVLMSYFAAIRQQIQRSANSQAWLGEADGEGLIYVSFLLASSGSIRDVATVPNRSVPSQQLRELGMRIVRQAAPFPPFPPSFQEAAKTIVVPLEFRLGDLE